MAIQKCVCKHEFQDATYGKGMRVHTEAKDKSLRCTVCSGPARWIARLKSHAMAHVATRDGGRE